VHHCGFDDLANPVFAAVIPHGSSALADARMAKRRIIAVEGHDASMKAGVASLHNGMDSRDMP
jgi:hypothetical protein